MCSTNWFDKILSTTLYLKLPLKIYEKTSFPQAAKVLFNYRNPKIYWQSTNALFKIQTSSRTSKDSLIWKYFHALLFLHLLMNYIPLLRTFHGKISYFQIEKKIHYCTFRVIYQSKYFEEFLHENRNNRL